MSSVQMKPMSFVRHAIAFVTLGLLCGWYYFLLLLLTVLIALLSLSNQIYVRALSVIIMLVIVVVTILPIKFPQRCDWFINHWIFDIWHEYFGFTSDCTKFTAHFKQHPSARYMFAEFPHGIFPMGQFLSASMIKTITPGQMIHGTGADIVFKIPIMRHIMAWVGTVPAKRQNISAVLTKPDCHLAIIPGGIAEMYLMSSDSEGIYLRTRLNTVKLAIQEGIHIVPVFFFGNTRILKLIGSSSSQSWLAKLSRKVRASIVLFYGRLGLPVPFRHPIHMCAGEVVEVEQKSFPSDADVHAVMDRLIQSVTELYRTSKPDWETRPLIIE